MKREEILNSLTTSWAAAKLVFYEETGSTNYDAKLLAADGAPHGTLVAADMQTAGRGRRGRTWTVLKGEAVCMSLILRPACLPEQTAALTLVMALAVVKAVKELTPKGSCGIKWPNDIVMNGKKICGILTELTLKGSEADYVVIGVGINANQSFFEEEIADKATSLFLELGEKTDRAHLICRVMHYFEQVYEEFAKTWDLTGLLEEYNGYLLNKDRQVRVLDPQGDYTGTALGINKQGELLVRRSDGSLTEVYAGEVSVRGIYGYV